MAGKLNARKVETVTKPGRYADGNNLYLFISPTAASGGPSSIGSGKALKAKKCAERSPRSHKDVTDRKTAEEHAQMLIREVNHRSNNLLSVVQVAAALALLNKSKADHLRVPCA